MSESAQLRVHAEQARSRANGPGIRYTVWVQGCTLACPGCFNGDTHEAAGPTVNVEELVARIENSAARGEIEGVTVSGGEPLQQADAVLALLRGVRAATELSVLLFSGYTLDEIEALPHGPDILSLLDVLIDGRYEAPTRVGRDLRGSANQRVHLLSDRYCAAEIAATPEAEIHIAADGSFTMSGVAPIKIR